MKIEINSATIEDLVQLNGIAEIKAKRIIAYRKQNNEFTNIEELTEVRGIGQAIFERIRQDIKVNNGTKIIFMPEKYNLENKNINEVHLVGEMNNWDPANKSYTLKKNDDGTWTGIFKLKTGTEYKILYDSDNWEQGNEIGGPHGENLVI